uniref:V-type proton ATPase subunit n=1 Tax=Panstrongylus lignarius TaxID=156445 RepID=A0A224XS74_9HEMI
MGYQVIPVAVITVFWFIIGFIVPCFIPKGPNRGVIVSMLMLIAICSWLFWLVNYMVQMNPLIGPALKRKTIMMMADAWGDNLESN